MKEQILNLSEKLLIRLTGYEPSLMSMLIKNFTFQFFLILLHMKQLFVVIEILIRIILDK